MRHRSIARARRCARAVDVAPFSRPWEMGRMRAEPLSARDARIRQAEPGRTRGGRHRIFGRLAR